MSAADRQTDHEDSWWARVYLARPGWGLGSEAESRVLSMRGGVSDVTARKERGPKYVTWRTQPAAPSHFCLSRRCSRVFIHPTSLTPARTFSIIIDTLRCRLRSRRWSYLNLIYISLWDNHQRDSDLFFADEATRMLLKLGNWQQMADQVTVTWKKYAKSKKCYFCFVLLLFLSMPGTLPFLL